MLSVPEAPPPKDVSLEWARAAAEAYERADWEAGGMSATRSHGLGRQIIAFRGTDELSDWMTSFDIVKIGGPLGRCHSGFLHAMLGLARKMAHEVVGLEYDFVGHSLGGAIATLFAAFTIEAGAYQPRNVATFGSPRVYANRNEYESHPINSWTWRFVNNNDVVTRVPTRLQGYGHVGKLMWIDVDGSVHQDWSRWQRFKDRVRGRFEDFLKPGLDGIKDHSIDAYVEALSK